MSSDNLPTIKVLLKPFFHINHPYIHITTTIQGSETEKDAIIATLPPVVNPPEILENHLLVEDGEGRKLEIVAKWDINTGTTWTALRNAPGNLVFRTRAYPPSKPQDHQLAPLDLHYSNGGFLGCGLSIIPLPKTDQIYRNIVEWDLSGTPEGTRAVWTFGEGPTPVERIGPVSLLIDSVYMTGPIKSNSSTTTPENTTEQYGYYWFGDLPPNIEIIRDIHHDFYLKVCAFFQDTPSPKNSYRSFVRNKTTSSAFGGTSFRNSQIFDYDGRISQARDFDLVRRMAYEMIHHWFGPSILNPEPDWFYQGIKNCLSIYLPFRNKFRTGEYFQDTINVLCERYYTNPYLNLKFEELTKLAEKNDIYAKEAIESRAWAFIIGTDLRARRLSKLVRPIEDLAIIPLVKRRMEGKSHGVEEWLELLESLLGNEAKERYVEFCDGTTILFPPTMFGAKTHYLKQVDQEILDFGVDRESFDEGIVKGLKVGSRAQEGELREGDKILRNSLVFRCVDYFEEKVGVVVEREGKEVVVVYWPRGFEMAKSWKMVKVEEG